MRMLKKTLIALCMGLVLCVGGATAAAAAPLTSAQVSSIISFLRAFGVDSSTVARVADVLTSSSATSTQPVQPIGPAGASSTVSFVAKPLSGAAPLTVSFSASGLHAGPQYIIDYGDGTTSGPLAAVDVCMHLADGSGGCPRVGATHTYTTAGTYNAVIEGYVACMWSNPRCLIATMSLGSATIRVGASSSATSAPVINAMNPTSGAVGTQVTLLGNNFSPTGNIVHFGSGAIANVSSKPAVYSCPMMPAGASTTGCGAGADEITFTVPSSVGPYCAPGKACPMYVMVVQPGSYPVSVENAGGTSNTETFTVTDNTALVPSSGK